MKYEYSDRDENAAPYLTETP